MDTSSMVDAQVIFVDARGFTSWSEKIDVFPFLDEFSVKFHEILNRNFEGFYSKNLGDGAMLIQEIKNDQIINKNFLKNLLKKTLTSIAKADKEFLYLLGELSTRFGSSIPLTLGWGVTKGWIRKLDGDYIGAEINKSARYCGIARPFGIVIDKEDFASLPDLPKTIDYKFFPQKRLLKGISKPVEVWVTKEIASQFLTRESIRHTPEVHVAGICLKKESGKVKALIAKRKITRKLFPGLYEGCGGQLTENETFITGVKRHFKLELNIDVDVVEDVHKFYYISQPNEHIIPGIKFLCIYKSGNEYSENHESVTWVSEEDLKSLPEEYFIQGLKSDFIDFIDKYKNL